MTKSRRNENIHATKQFDTSIPPIRPCGMILEHRGKAGIAWCSSCKPHWGFRRAARGSRATFRLHQIDCEDNQKGWPISSSCPHYYWVSCGSPQVGYPVSVQDSKRHLSDRLTQELIVTDCTRCMNCWITFGLWSSGLWQNSTVKMEAASFSESSISA
jgi:hypothetical protein